jgi:hypothetical protein
MSLSPRGLSATLLAFSLLAGCQALVNAPGADGTGAEPTAAPSVTHVGRLGGVGNQLGSLAEQPHLEIVTTASFRWLWDEQGTGSRETISVWRPQAPSNEYALIGDYAHGTHLKPAGGGLLVKAINEDPANPLLKAPVDYELRWESRGAGGKSDGSFWEPIAPPGYVAIGMVGNAGFTKPLLDTYRCVREDLCEQRPYGDRIWHDKGTSARMDGALFSLPEFPGGFGTFNSYASPQAQSWILKKPTETHDAD